MASEAFWIDVLTGVYQHLRSQQEIILQLSVGMDALTKTLSQSDPDFAKKFDRQYDLSMKGPLGQTHTSVLAAIDLSIEGLRNMPKNVN